MFDWLKKIFSNEPSKNNENENQEQYYDYSSIASGLAAGSQIENEISNANARFAKPETYTGNRNLYDDGGAKLRAKQRAFANGKTVRDNYTNEELTLTVKEAKLRYGKDWQKHLAESDHITPIERVHEQTKDNPWLDNQDVKEIANSDDNIEVVSRTYNNAKRSKTNKELVNDDEYLEKTGLKLSKKGKEKAVQRGEESQAAIDKQVQQRALSNAVETAHTAGVNTAVSAGTMAGAVSAVSNIVSVLKGEKSAEEAIADLSKDTAKSTVIGYAVGSGGTAIAQTLSTSSSKFIQALAKSNVPGQVIATVMATGDVIANYMNGKITTEQCLRELGQRSAGMSVIGYGMGVGQTLIPIPVVGAAVGAIAGSVLSNFLYVNTNRFAAENEAILARTNEYRKLKQDAIEYRKELQYYLDNYFQGYRNCCDDALGKIHEAFNNGDVNGVIAGANQITRASGGSVRYNNMQEFDNYMMDDSTDYL